jgi:uncharacterized repeat protein (TIGR01451 family)
VAILSSPWATLDHNNPSGSGEDVPQVFVVEAVVTNTGNVLAEDITVTLSYSSTDWVLLTDEDPQRTLDELPRGEDYHFYWFARYPTTIGAAHQYTVTADAKNAGSISTSDNYYGNPETGATVKTRSALSTGNSGVSQVSTEIVVGVAFTITIGYDLGSDPLEIVFSPAGNDDFDPSAYRLLSTQVRFYDDADVNEEIVDDRLYFPSGALPSFADNAEATYTFIAATPSDTRLCSYAAVGYGSTNKYDQFYCSEKRGTAIPITGTLSLSLTKEALPSPVQQNQLLTYTLRYTNTGSLPLQYVWFWDQVDTAIGSIVTPPGHPPDHIDWYFETIPPNGELGYTGTLTFTILVNGNYLDLPDQTPLVNRAFFGINQGSLPKLAALTTTLTTTIEAPAITIHKTDGLDDVEPGHALTYTLRITNSGSVSATEVVITDELPFGVSYAPGTASEPETSLSGQTLVWDHLGPIQPGGGTIAITIPVTVAQKAPDGLSLLNRTDIDYQNPAGWPYAVASAEDSTTVHGPVLTIYKIDEPDPVLTGRWLTYTLHYANNGQAQATDVVITDVVPLSTTNPACSGGSSCTVNGGVITWNIPAVSAGSVGSVQFSVQVSETLETGTILHNDDYGIFSQQTEYAPGPAVTTEVRRDAAFFVGYAFVDANGSGDFQQGTEEVLPGITITLPSASVPVTHTNEEGYYSFRVEYQDPITISAALPSGYFRTTPGAIVFAEAELGITKTVNFGYAPITSTFGVVYGTVFEDGDHDGVQETGEVGLPGVQISSTLALTSPVFTDELGWYTFRYDTPGTATITERDPLYYVSTTPNITQTEVMTGSENGSPYDFGDFLGIKISGQVFDDEDVDGFKDPLEVGVPNAVVSAQGESYATTHSGIYVLYLTPDTTDSLAITEDDPPGYLSTAALPGNEMVRVDANTLRITSPVSGTTYAGGDFGDVLASGAITISGTVWDDNGAGGGQASDGLRNGTEPGLPGAIVAITRGLTQTTGADGLFQLYARPGEPLTVTETNPDGYVSTNAIAGNHARKVDNDTLVVGPLAGGLTSANNLFGDVLASSVSILNGAVFDDANENGILDGGEAGLPGVTVTLEIEGSTLPIEVHTSPTGTYEFAVAPGTNVRITSSGPGGAFYPTTVESVVIRPTTPGPQPPLDFGYSDDQDVSIIHGLVFDDKDGDGELDLGELGLGAAVITLTLEATPIATFTTTSNGLLAGTFTFSVTRPTSPTVYGVHEKNPPGYISTTSDDIKVTVSPDTSHYYVEFGDTDQTNRAFVVGTVFDDLDGNGLEDSSEPGLPGVMITLTGTAEPIMVTTKAYGQYSFRLSEEGLYAVREQDPAKEGYHSTTADVIPVDVELGQTYDVDFGDTMLTASNIIGIVYEDISQDGVHNPLSEPGLPGVTVTLSSGMSATTGDYGQYGFPADPGYVQVIETDPPGYHSTTPNTVTVHVTAPQDYVVNFGDRQFGLSFFGTVFDDENINGEQESTEPGLAGVTVTITGPFDSPIDPFLTNQWGQYTFPIEKAGTYTITETDPEGYISTIAIPADPAVSWVDNNTLRLGVLGLTPSRDFGDNLFGDALASQAITIGGSVWDDNGAGGGTAGDGIRNGSEPGLAGAGISLSSGLALTTDADGQFLLYAPSDELITVTETNPDGYVSTAAISGSGAVYIDNDTLEIGPLAGGSTSSDNRFGDVLPADLEVEKAANHDPVVAGTILTYTLVYTNHGPSYAQSIWITDSLPEDVIFGGVVSQPGYLSGPELAGRLLAWEPFTLTSGLSGSIDFTVTVASDTITGTLLINSTGINSNLPDTNPGNNQSSAESTVYSEADLSLNKAGISASTLAGQPFTYTLTIANEGPSDATGIVVTDTLPADMAFVNATGAICSSTEQDIACNPFDLAVSDDPIVITLSVNVAPSATYNTILTNTAATFGNQFDPNQENNTDEVATKINREADLSLDKTGFSSSAIAGRPFTYTLTVSNHGPSEATGIVVTDSLPAGMSLAGATGATCSDSGQDISCDAFDLPVGDDPIIITLSVSIAPSVTHNTILTNTAATFGSELDPSSSDNTATETTTVNREADLSLDKTGFSDSAIAGQPFTYTLTISNQGPSDASGILVTDTLPAGMSLVNATGATCLADDQEITCQPFGIAFGDDPVVITVYLDVASSVADDAVLVNKAAAHGIEYDPNPGDNTASETTTITREASLSLAKTGYSASALAGQPFTYTLTLANHGPSDASNIVLTDTLPAGIDLVEITGATCTALGQEVNCDPIDLAFGDSPVLVTLSVDVEPSVTHDSVLTNTAAAFGDEADPDTDDNTASVSTTVARWADLAIHKTAQPDPVAAGTVLTYTLTYTNAGPSDALHADLTDTLDVGVAFGGVVQQPPSWTGFDQTAGTLTWHAPSLPTGEADAVVFTVTVRPGAVGSLFNTASIDSNTQDAVADNNQSETTTYIGHPGQATIYGYVFQDLNCNGLWDSGEVALPDPDVNLTAPTAQSPSYGDNHVFYFVTDQPGVHAVVQTDAAGDFSTTPNEVHLAVTLGQSFRVDFGDAPDSAKCAAVHGTVFDDLDSSGSWDTGELGLSGVTITLDGVHPTTTGKYGGYTLATAQAGAHSVVETDPAGYSSTTPNEVDLDVSLGASYQVDFGDISFCTCEGDQYEEDDTSAQAVALTVGQTQTHNFCDDVADWTYLVAEARQTYTITTSSWGQRADTYLALYDTDGQTLLVATDDFEDTGDYSSRIVWMAPRDGTYYLLATNRGGLTGCDTGYDLRLDLSRTYFLFLPLSARDYGPEPEAAQSAAERLAAPALGGPDPEIALGPTGIISHTCPDAFEINDTWSLANPILDGVAQIHSFDSNPAQWAADKDFVWFDLQQGRTITFTVTSVTNTRTQLELFDSQGNSLNVTGTTELIWTAPTVGRYYLSVSPQLATYGCTEPVEGRPVVSYKLQADWEPRTFLYLPIVVRNAGSP